MGTDELLLNEITIDGGRRGLLNIIVFRVSDYADNLVRDLALRQRDMAQRQMFPNRVFVAEAIACGNLIHDCYEWFALIISGKVAAGEQGCAVRFKVVRGDIVDRNVVLIVRVPLRKCKGRRTRALHRAHSAQRG